MASDKMTPLEALQALAYDLYLASARPDSMMATLADYERLQEVHVLKSAIDELAALRAWKERATQPLMALMEVAAEQNGWCQFCRKVTTDNRPHAAKCPVTIALALLAESEGQA